MDWRNALFIKYNLGSTGKKIILDQTGILASSDFQNFLKEKGIVSVYAAKLSQLLSQISDPSVRVILTSVSDIPAYLQHKADLYHFGYEDLPFPAEPCLLQSLSAHQTVSLCNYLSVSQPHTVIAKHNLPDLLKNAEKHQQEKEINILKNQIDHLLSQKADYSTVIEMGMLWGKLMYALYKIRQENPKEIQIAMDQYVLDYILSDKLKNIWYLGPGEVKSVDRIIRWLQYQNMEKFAIVCFDAMGVAEWEVLKNHLVPHDFHFHEKFIYALIPTTTAISRAALFSGENEMVYHAKSVNESKEFRKKFPGYEHRHFREKDLISPDKLLGITAVTMIFSFFDELAHAACFPPGSDTKHIYFDTVKNWMDRLAVEDIFHLLLQQGFRVFACSDHGSVVADGNGKNIERWMQDRFARRGCMAEESILLEFYDYPQYQIPFVKGKTVLLPEKRTMFHHAGKIAIAHGGVTVDELIVPFAEITI